MQQSPCSLDTVGLSSIDGVRGNPGSEVATPIREASSGDKDAARERLSLTEGIPLLAITDAAELAARLVDGGAVPTPAASLDYDLKRITREKKGVTH